MKFSIHRQTFLTNLLNVSKAIPSKSAIPILTGIKIELTQDHLILIGSDATISIQSTMSTANDSLNLTVDETGSIVLPSRFFIEIIKKLPTNDVSIESQSSGLTVIKSGTAEFQIQGAPGSDYPNLPEIELEQPIKLPTQSFKEMINQTIFSASNQEQRPILTGLHLAIHPTHITATATDSHRLSKREIYLEEGVVDKVYEPIVLPKKTVVELSKILNDEDPLHLVITEQQVVFVIHDLTIYSRLLEGNYPDTDRLIPRQHDIKLVLNVQDFVSSIERASLLVHESKTSVVQLKIENGDVTLLVLGADIGKSDEQIKFDSVEGGPISISFNPDYMREALKSFGDISVQLLLQNAARPLLLKSADEQANSHNTLVQLLTPIRTHYN